MGNSPAAMQAHNMGGCLSRQSHKVASGFSKPASPHITVHTDPADPALNRTAEEARIQAEKARTAPSLDLSKSALWTRRKSAVGDEETGM